MLDSDVEANEGGIGATLEKYIPSEEQLKQVGILQKLVEKCKQEEVDISIIGGYGLDGLYGKLTRDHKDIDLLVKDGGETKLCGIVASLGFTEEAEETNRTKTVFKPEEGFLNTFKIEFAPASSASKLLPATAHKESIFPTEENGSLMGFSFKTPTLEGHRIITEVQNEKAAEKGWGAFPHKAHSEELMKALEEKSK